jgi:hypothetical protein
LAIVIVFACQPEPLRIDVPQAEPELVVASQTIPNSIIFISLTRSFGALEFGEEDSTVSEDLQNQILVDSAVVTISYEGRTDTLFPLAPGIYGSFITPLNEGTEYLLYAKDYDTGKEVYARNTILPTVDFQTILPEIERSENDTLVKVNFTFNDPIGPNWYMINVYANRQNEDTTFNINAFLADGNNAVLNTTLLSDLTFDQDGSTQDISLNLPLAFQTDTIAVTISNISETYYKYIDLRQRSGNIFSQITSEPINYPTNVEGGLGFFNTHFTDIEVFDLNLY